MTRGHSTRMTSARPGRRTLGAEATNVSRQGFWLLVAERDRFVSFDLFPWFREATMGRLVEVTTAHPCHLDWP